MWINKNEAAGPAAHFLHNLAKWVSLGCSLDQSVWRVLMKLSSSGKTWQLLVLSLASLICGLMSSVWNKLVENSSGLVCGRGILYIQEEIRSHSTGCCISFKRIFKIAYTSVDKRLQIMLFECLMLMHFCCCSLPDAPINAPTSWQDFAVSGQQLPSGSTGCRPTEPTAETEREVPAGIWCFVQGSSVQVRPAQGRSSTEVGKRVAEGVKVCIWTGDN